MKPERKPEDQTQKPRRKQGRKHPDQGRRDPGQAHDERHEPASEGSYEPPLDDE